MVVLTGYCGEQCDALIALHARKSHASIIAFRTANPGRPVVLCLTGTDVYQDLQVSAEAQESVALADKIITLQPLAASELPEVQRGKVRVVLQSAVAPAGARSRRKTEFTVCVVGHLRSVKEPFLTEQASRLLPPESRIRVRHLGGAIEEGMAQQALDAALQNPRYMWLGERSKSETMREIASAHLLALTSRLEGGANAISEAIICGTPVVSSRIPGSVGLLGEEYPGYFEPGNAADLARVLNRAENQSEFYEELNRRCMALAPHFTPTAEADALVSALSELGLCAP